MIKPTGVITIGLIALLTITSGIVFGMASSRWGAPEKVTTAAGLLEKMPQSIGNWKVHEKHEFSERVNGILKCESYIYRTYINEETNRAVQVAVMLGPTGTISAHVPEICFSTQAHTQRGDREKLRIGDDEFWSLTFDPNTLEGGIVRVHYSWKAKENWEATENRRFAFIGIPYLYKLQLSSMLPPNSDVEISDPCPDFLRDFLPALREQLEE